MKRQSTRAFLAALIIGGLVCIAYVKLIVWCSKHNHVVNKAGSYCFIPASSMIRATVCVDPRVL